MRKPAGAKFANVVPADVAGALDELGIDYIIRGDEANALCPHPDHNDSSPSWSVNLHSGMHHCFSCGYGGSFIKLVANVRGGKFAEAEVWIRTHTMQSNLDGVEIVAQAKERRAAEVRESDLWEVGPPPAEMLAGRNVSSGAAELAEVQWHPEKGCWIFPVRDPFTDKLTGWQEKSERRFINRPRGLDKTQALFGFRHLKATGRSGYVVVVESPLDVARFITAGVDRVVATYGSEFTQKQIEILWDYADVIIFALDNDDAGQKRVARYLLEHPEDAPHCKVFDYGTAYVDRDFRQWYIHPLGDHRDPGNLTDADLWWGVDNATPGTWTMFEAVG
jgi:5S rRNA maturation endonuclease (ribonuclease M5)